MIITDIKQQKHNKNMYSIFIDNNYLFSLEDIDIVNLGIKIGQELTEQDVEFYKQKFEYTKAKEKALNYISYKMRTEKEVRDKLQNLGYNEDIINKVIEKLIELKYINDIEYVDLYINEKLKLRPCGKRLLEYELKNKGVDEKIISKKLEEFEIDEYDIAYKLAQKKTSKLNSLNEKELRKLYSFLARKGFSNSLAMEVIKDIQKQV